MRESRFPPRVGPPPAGDDVGTPASGTVMPQYRRLLHGSRGESVHTRALTP